MPEQTIVRLRLRYPLEHVREPLLYHLIMDYNLVPNIYEAQIDAHSGGSMVVDLAGLPDDIERGTRWLQSAGITAERCAE